MISQPAYNSSHTKLKFIGASGQDTLSVSSVLVIGAGGLGCPCLQALSGAGFGKIGIADIDTISASNLHRQSLYQAADIGKAKTSIAAQRLRANNPFINVIEHCIFVDLPNVLNLLEDYDIIVDATDNFITRYLINDACIALGKPLVYGAIHQTEGHLTVFNYNGSGTLRCLFTQNETAVVESCAVIGAYNIVTTMIGTMMANEVIKLMLNHEAVLANTLLQLDVLEGKILRIKYELQADNIAVSKQLFQQQLIATTISATVLQSLLLQGKAMLLIDVRDDLEHTAFNIGGINLPLQQLLSTQTFHFNPVASIILYCHKGIRSQQAVQWLRQHGYPHAQGLQGGIENWNEPG